MRNKAYVWYKGIGYVSMSRVGIHERLGALSKVGPYRGINVSSNISEIGKYNNIGYCTINGGYTISKVGLINTVTMYNYGLDNSYPSQVGIRK